MGMRIQRPDVGAALQRFLRLTGTVRPELEAFIIPTISVGDLTEGSAPPVIRRATCLISEPAVVGERMLGRFEMIPGAIAVIRKISIHESAGGGFLAFANRGNAATLAALASVSAKGYLDGRILPGSGQSLFPAATMTTGTQVASMAALSTHMAIPAEGLLYDVPGQGWVVGTGDPTLFGFFEFQVTGVNSLVRGSFEWDEHPIV